jgi:DNA-binding transcriptional regulator LsrR (DeoR family)
MSSAIEDDVLEVLRKTPKGATSNEVAAKLEIHQTTARRALAAWARRGRVVVSKDNANGARGQRPYRYSLTSYVVPTTFTVKDAAVTPVPEQSAPTWDVVGRTEQGIVLESDGVLYLARELVASW